MTYMSSILARKGVEVSGDEYRRLKAERRAKNVVNAIEVLTRHSMNFRVARNWPETEFHVRTKWNALLFYYPARGIWFTEDGERRFGVRNLVKYAMELEKC